MSGQTKYSAAAQRDSLDDETAHFTQAPPSYVDEPSSSAQDDATLLAGGARRNSEDNVPDDFKVGSACAKPRSARADHA